MLQRIANLTSRYDVGFSIEEACGAHLPRHCMIWTYLALRRLYRDTFD